MTILESPKGRCQILVKSAFSIWMLFSVTACASAGGGGFSSSSGPSRSQVDKGAAQHGIQVVDVDQAVTQRLLAQEQNSGFSDYFKETKSTGHLYRPGDAIEISIWEAPPATLFGGDMLDTTFRTTGARAVTFPEQMVSGKGTLNVPFAGQLKVAGLSSQQIEQEIVKRLQHKANQPQVLVKLARNNSANVTIVGEVTNSLRMPLTPSNEKLLDALAAAGGVKHASDKVTMQITRGSEVHSMPLDSIIRDPRQNVSLQPGDVVTALYQPNSFTALGAVAKNEEINFEAKGIKLSQALGRIGGLLDSRANAKSVFIFRYESTLALNQNDSQQPGASSVVPVIYRINLKDPATFFAAQHFSIKNGDILYVSNSPAADLQKFLNTVISAVFPIMNVINATK